MEVLLAAFAACVLLLAFGLFLYVLGHFGCAVLVAKFNSWWKGRFRKGGIKVSGYNAALALGLCIMPLVSAVALKQWPLAFYIAPPTFLAFFVLSTRGWLKRGNSKPRLLKFAKLFYEPAGYFASLVFGASKVAEWVVILNVQKLALLW
jgi:hypothetical protein